METYIGVRDADTVKFFILYHKLVFSRRSQSDCNPDLVVELFIIRQPREAKLKMLENPLLLDECCLVKAILAVRPDPVQMRLNRLPPYTLSTSLQDARISFLLAGKRFYFT